jgi:hypothetical protein
MVIVFVIVIVIVSVFILYVYIYICFSQPLYLYTYILFLSFHWKIRGNYYFDVNMLAKHEHEQTTWLWDGCRPIPWLCFGEIASSHFDAPCCHPRNGHWCCACAYRIAPFRTVKLAVTKTNRLEERETKAHLGLFVSDVFCMFSEFFSAFLFDPICCFQGLVVSYL